MTYSGASQAASAREQLSRALSGLQQDPNIPPDVMAVAENMAQAMGQLFQAEKAAVELDGKNAVRACLGSLSQTLALLQDVRSAHPGIAVATEAIAKVMSILFPLTTVPSRAPAPPAQPVAVPQIPQAAPVPQFGGGYGAPSAFGATAPAQQAQFGPHAGAPAPAPAPQAYAPPQQAYAPPPQASVPAPQHGAPPAPRGGGPRQEVEANIGATTESNFYVGFSGEIAEGGVFVATYNTLAKGTPMVVLITLPGGFETRVNGWVRFVRDPMDFTADSEPGMGVQFEGLTGEQRDLILRFVRKRAPLFLDD